MCDQIIDAHSIQRSKSLRQICDQVHKVQTFYAGRLDNDGRLTQQPKGWREASTFTGFCSKHDNETFAPIEKVEFTGTPEQGFLLAYRALCHEIYQKEGARNAENLIADLPISVPPEMMEWMQQSVDEALRILEPATQKALIDQSRLKSTMDAQLLSKTYTGWSGATISFTGDLCLTSVGVITPRLDLVGNVLQSLDEKSDLESLMVSLISTDNGGTLSFFWQTNQSAPRRFVESLLARPVDELPSYIVQVIFAHLENTFFSSSWWNSLNDDDRQHLEGLASITNPYFAPIEFSPSTFVPWQVTNVHSFQI
ncbi:MAG TPA: hypothetical protein VFO76_12855 [Candidatus Kapabacteria bacterium]|nr:hypothetical protein [Candidatus Kapabacteria bacterium]